MADFNIGFKLTSDIEGGWANDKDDKGGKTWKGIAYNKNPHWVGWQIIAKFEHRDDFPKCLYSIPYLEDAVKTFYKLHYWDFLNLSRIEDQRVATELYDTAVNMGVGVAGIFFQRVINAMNINEALYPDLKVDGNIGLKTVNSFNMLSAKDKNYALRLLNALQGAKYMDIVEYNHKQEKFMRSWASRVFEYFNA